MIISHYNVLIRAYNIHHRSIKWGKYGRCNGWVDVNIPRSHSEMISLTLDSLISIYLLLFVRLLHVVCSCVVEKMYVLMLTRRGYLLLFNLKNKLFFVHFVYIFIYTFFLTLFLLFALFIFFFFLLQKHWAMKINWRWLLLLTGNTKTMNNNFSPLKSNNLLCGASKYKII